MGLDNLLDNLYIVL